MNGIEITTTLTQADWRAYRTAWGQRLQTGARHGRSRLKSFALVFAVSFALAIALSALAAELQERMPVIAFLAGAALSFATIVFVQRRIQARATPDPEGAILGCQRVSFQPEGIRQHKAGAQAEYAWALVKDVTVTTEHVFVWIDRVAAIIVPLRDLPAGRDAKSVVEQILATAASAGREVEAATPIAAPLDTTFGGAGAETVSSKHFARAAARLFTLRTADANALYMGDWTAASILVASIGLLIGADWLLAEPGSGFYPYGLLACSWYVLLALLALWLSSKLSEPRIGIRRLVAIAIAFAPAAVVLSLLLAAGVNEELRIAVVVVIALYVMLVLERALRSITLRPQPRALAAAMLVVCLAAWLNQRFYMSVDFWYPNYETEEAGSEGASVLARWRASEKTLFEQAERIRTAVEGLERPAALESAAFFVGFAGMGEQRVFAGEIALAEQEIARKFATTGRAVRLVNDRRDLDALPLASPTALRYTLNALARTMDLERDVLFLALSSHGSEAGSLSVSNSSLPLNDLTATELADALREAGMKWRVIIVSACYAGKFIDPLRDDHTIVIAAAAADRTSFGCSDDRDLTYFGEAFYRDSLSSAANLRAAFVNATRLVAERERLEAKTESNPQAHFGPAIERYLEERFSR